MFQKYPKTFRVRVPQFNVPGKLFLSDKEVQALLAGQIWITEKLDGANIGIIRTSDGFRLQKRGSLVDTSEHEQFNFFKAWAYTNYEKIMALPSGFLYYGELLRCMHNIYYDSLPDWIAFFAKSPLGLEGEFDKIEDTREVIEAAGLVNVPLVYCGAVKSRADLVSFIPSVSLFGSGPAEGIVIWNKHGLRGKVVRSEFVKELEEDEHWTKKAIKINSLRE